MVNACKYALFHTIIMCCSMLLLYVIDLHYIPIVFHHSSCEAKPLVVMTGKKHPLEAYVPW